jgi:heat-inducible transcriptional repressor
MVRAPGLGMQLTERQERILKAIIDSYVEGAHPVASSTVVAASNMGISSATVRNEMAELEDLGLIQHLHTSGGRVPTDAGYRYYIEHLMRSEPLPNTEATTIRHQFHESHAEVEEWLKLAAGIIAARLRNVGLITAPRPAEVRLRHVEAVSIQPSTALLIVVLSDSTVLQEMTPLAAPHSQEVLSVQADRVTAELRGMTAFEIERRIPLMPEGDLEIARMVVKLLRRAERAHAEVYHAGLAELIRQPEFLGARPGETPTMVAERLRHMVEFLQQGMGVEQLVAGLSHVSEVQVVFGAEAGDGGLEGYSFVLARYGSQDDSSGYLGVVGPTRMQYPRAVSLVRYMTDLMTDLIEAY